jgi:hypothetical protein
MGLIDGTDANVASEDAYDDMWGHWEEAAYDEIAGALASTGATYISYNGHQEWTGDLVAAAERNWGRLGLVAATRMAPVSDDRSIAEGMLAQVRHQIVAEPYQARVLRADPGHVAELVAEHVRIGGTPVFVLDARLPERLLSAYRWGAEERAWLSQTTEPVVGIRLIVADGSGRSEIVLIPVAAAADVEKLVGGWAARGPAIAVLAASCLIDTAWQREWWGSISRSLRTVVLIDIEPARLTRSWSASRQVRMAAVTVEDAASRWQGLAVEAGGDVLWLALGDQITANFLRHAIGPAVDAVEGSDFLTGWSEPLRVAATHLLATETFFDFAGLEARL